LLSFSDVWFISTDDLLSFDKTRSITLKPIGSIITALAVFETHMLRTAVMPMNPATMLFGLVPANLNTKKAMRL